MTIDENLLVSAAVAARAHAHAPYSSFAVGAALESTDGRVFSGCNVENASFGLTVCAERNALGAAIAAGARKFRRIAVVSRGAAAPCGACRQVLSEFGIELEVLRADDAGTIVARTTLRALLPEHFGPQQL